jgi:hypothetical protein
MYLYRRMPGKVVRAGLIDDDGTEARTRSPMYMHVHRDLADRTERSLFKHCDYESDRESDGDTCTRGFTYSDEVVRSGGAIS